MKMKGCLRTNNKNPERHEDSRDHIEPENKPNSESLCQKAEWNCHNKVLKISAPVSQVFQHGNIRLTADNDSRLHDALQPCQLLLNLIQLTKLLRYRAIRADYGRIALEIILST